MTKVNSVLLLPLGREWTSSQPPPGVKERVYEAVIEEKTKEYIFLRICKDCCDELGLQPDRELQVWAKRSDLFGVSGLHSLSGNYKFKAILSAITCIFYAVNRPPCLWHSSLWVLFPPYSLKPACCLGFLSFCSSPRANSSFARHFTPFSLQFHSDLLWNHTFHR